MFLFKRKQKTVLVTIHGFGKKVSHEFDPLYTALKNKKYDIVTFDFFDPEDKNDHDWKQWIKRCEEKMDQIEKDYDHIYMLGFSMGGVIASYLATIYPIEQLILVAPAFQYLNATKIVEYGVKGLMALRNQKPINPQSMSSEFVFAFSEIIAQYKESIAQVDCPVLFLHGSEDEVIPVSSSKDAYQKVSGKKLLLQVEGGKHRMLYDNTLEHQLFPIIQLVMENKLF